MNQEKINRKEKTCLITGGSSGIGKAIAKRLAHLGHQVVIVSNNKDENDLAKSEIIEDTGNINVYCYLADFSSQKEIREFVNELVYSHKKLDILINNAGVNLSYKKKTQEGFEYMFAVNHLAPFLLTNLLLEKFTKGIPLIIINIGSNGERFANLDFENLQGEKKFNSMKQYCMTKLCNLLFTYELARKLNGKNTFACCIHPGGVKTHIMKHYKKFSLPKVTWHILYPFLKTPDHAAEYVEKLIRTDEYTSLNGKYFKKNRVAQSSNLSYDKNIAAKLWEISAQFTNIKKSSIL